MKKLILTIATVAAFSIVNAQDAQPAVKQEPTKKKATTTSTEKTTKKETAGNVGATTEAKSDSKPVGESTGTATATKPTDKKTRMAINEKGLPGERKPAAKSNPK